MQVAGVVLKWLKGDKEANYARAEKLITAAAPQLSAEERAFLDGPCEELCSMLDDWEITHKRGDMPPAIPDRWPR